MEWCEQCAWNVAEDGHAPSCIYSGNAVDAGTLSDSAFWGEHGHANEDAWVDFGGEA